MEDLFESDLMFNKPFLIETVNTGYELNYDGYTSSQLLSLMMQEVYDLHGLKWTKNHTV